MAVRELIDSSPDERVQARVRGDGCLTGVRLRDNVLQRDDNAALAELVTRTVRGAQRRARAELQRALGEADAAGEPDASVGEPDASAGWPANAR